MNPALIAVAGQFAQGVGSSIAKGGTPGGPSNAASGAYGSGLDGSGWSVNFGSGSQSTQQQQDKSGGAGGYGFTGNSANGWAVYAALAVVAGVVLWRMKSKR